MQKLKTFWDRIMKKWMKEIFELNAYPYCIGMRGASAANLLYYFHFYTVEMLTFFKGLKLKLYIFFGGHVLFFVSACHCIKAV